MSYNIPLKRHPTRKDAARASRERRREKERLVGDVLCVAECFEGGVDDLPNCDAFVLTQTMGGIVRVIPSEVPIELDIKDLGFWLTS